MPLYSPSLQRTLAEKITCSGVGLHSGEHVNLALCPAEPDSGVVFVRREGDRSVEIPARSEFVSSTANATTLARDGVRVSTVEHLLAALHGLGLDNVRVELDADELPAMDGSAESFAYLVESAGTCDQPAPRRQLVITRALALEDGARSIRIEPARRGFSARYEIDFAHPAIGRQQLELAELSPGVFRAELARARTFGFLDQLDALQAAGLARGASLDNTIAIDAEGIVNPRGLRWPDEFVRHKLLDLVGDLALLGHPIRGRVEVQRGGHALHHRLVEALVADPSCWELEASGEPSLAAAAGLAEFSSPI